MRDLKAFIFDWLRGQSGNGGPFVSVWESSNNATLDGDFDIAQLANAIVDDYTAKPILIEDLRGAVARAWARDINKGKVMDVDLAAAVVNEVIALILECKIEVVESMM